MEDKPENTGVNKVTVENIPAMRFDYNNGSDPDINEDLVFYGSEATIPSCKISITGKTFREWNTTWNGKGVSFKAGSTAQASVVAAEAAKQNKKILTVYAIWDINPTNLHTNY